MESIKEFIANHAIVVVFVAVVAGIIIGSLM